MSIKSDKFFGQHGVDILLWNFFDKDNGFFIDVGAHDGISLSNSYFFEQKGWNGICVEANPEKGNQCKQNRKCIVEICACVSNSDMKITDFFVHNSKNSFISCVDPDIDAVEILTPRAKGCALESFKKIKVPCKSLNNIIENNFSINPKIDFLSVDVEGTELDVLKGFDFDKYKPRLLIIESNRKSDKIKIDNFLFKKEYLYSGSISINAFYVNNEIDKKKLENLKNPELSEHFFVIND